MNRIADWHTHLADFIHSRLRTPFAWGSQDCALFACDAVQVITGTDLAADFRGKYADARAALVAIREYAGGGIDLLAEKKAAQFGLKEVPINFASRGDIVLIQQDGDPESRLALGIVGMNGRHALCAGDEGLKHITREQWVKAWKI